MRIMIYKGHIGDESLVEKYQILQEKRAEMMQMYKTI